MIVLGLTGSIGMGKTTTAGLFAAQGAAVYEADAAVHVLYQPGGPAGPALRARFPTAVTDAGEVERDRLKDILRDDPARLGELEDTIFPLLAESRRDLLHEAAAAGRSLSVLEIPLLYETGGEASVDGVVVVTASPSLQRERVMSRPGMTEETFDLLLKRQIADVEKRARADFVVHTDVGLQDAAEQVSAIVRTVLQPGWLQARGGASTRGDAALGPQH